MKKVYIAHDPTEAYLVKGLLETEEIPVVIQGEHLFALRGEIPITADTNPSVWVVEDAHFARARALVAALSRTENSPLIQAQPWQCRQCGEILEGQFTACWRCGTSRLPEQ